MCVCVCVTVKHFEHIKYNRWIIFIIYKVYLIVLFALLSGYPILLYAIISTYILRAPLHLRFPSIETREPHLNENPLYK